MNGTSFTAIAGNLSKDPEMKYTPTGKSVTTFSIPVNKQYLNAAGEEVKETTWFRIEVWGKIAEACNSYLKKGSAVFVRGQIVPDKETGGPRIWTDKNGNPRASYEIRADEVVFLSAITRTADMVDEGF